MNVIIFGATGMVGQGVLRECLLAPDVQKVLSVGRSASGTTDPKLRDLPMSNLYDFSGVREELRGYDACFFCLGVTSAGMQEEDYRRITKDIVVAVAKELVQLNPTMTLVFVSGRGADSAGTSRVMWARVKGEAENALLAMPFKGVYVFRPGMIEALHGITSRTRAYRILYPFIRPFVPLFRWLSPGSVTTTQNIGRAMLHLVRHGGSLKILHNADIDAVARSAAA